MDKSKARYRYTDLNPPFNKISLATFSDCVNSTQALTSFDSDAGPWTLAELGAVSLGTAIVSLRLMLRKDALFLLWLRSSDILSMQRRVLLTS